jgi:hypothetical protein
MITLLEGEAKQLYELAASAVTLDGPVFRDYGSLVTDNEQVAKDYGFMRLEAGEESEEECE